MWTEFLSPNVFEFSLQSRRRARVFLLAAAVSGLWMAAKVVRISLADTLGESADKSRLYLALSLDPVNPRIHRQLGLVYSFSLGDINTSEAVKEFRQAVDLSPQNAYYRSDLAAACEEVGDNACADQALDRALSLSPMTPRLHWITANHYLRTERTAQALAHFQRLLNLSPSYARQTFRLSLRVIPDPQVVYEKILSSGSNSKLRLAYVDFLSEQGDLGNAYQVWRKFVPKSSPFDFREAQPFLDHLLDTGQIPEAQSVWRDLIRLGAVKRPNDPDLTNLVFNGSFERRPLNAGFDWRLHAGPYVSVDFPEASSIHGAHCLRVDFTVRDNEEYEPVHQIVPVAPGQTYLLTAYVRSKDVTSDSGPRLRVLDPLHPESLYAVSEATLGTTSWHPLTTRFETGTQTHYIRLSIWRPRSRSFPNEISGAFWVDAISLRPSPD